MITVSAPISRTKGVARRCLQLKLPGQNQYKRGTCQSRSGNRSFSQEQSPRLLLQKTRVPSNFKQHLLVNTHVPSFRTKSAFTPEVCLAHFLALTLGTTLKHLHTLAEKNTDALQLPDIILESTHPSFWDQVSFSS